MHVSVNWSTAASRQQGHFACYAQWWPARVLTIMCRASANPHFLILRKLRLLTPALEECNYTHSKLRASRRQPALNVPKNVKRPTTARAKALMITNPKYTSTNIMRGAANTLWQTRCQCKHLQAFSRGELFREGRGTCMSRHGMAMQLCQAALTCAAHAVVQDLGAGHGKEQQLARAGVVQAARCKQATASASKRQGAPGVWELSSAGAKLAHVWRVVRS